MPNQYIIDYLKRNKDKFSFEVLKEKLFKAGYPSDQIEEARKIVYEKKEEIVAPSPFIKEKKILSFWDFWHKKVYTSGGEKILDFGTGFVFAIILKYIILLALMSLRRSFSFFDLFGYYIFFLIIIIYFLIKRRYIALGIICEIILSSVFRISSLLHYYF